MKQSKTPAPAPAQDKAPAPQYPPIHVDVRIHSSRPRAMCWPTPPLT